MAARKGPPRRTGGNKPKVPWSPNPTQLEWYRKWTEECKGPTQIAAEHFTKITPQTVCEAVHKVMNWLRCELFDQIVAYRERVTTLHERIIQNSLQSFADSKGLQTVETNAEGSSGNPHGDEYESKTIVSTLSQGDPSYLEVAQASATAIANLWGLNAPAKSNASFGHSEDIPGIPGGQEFANREEARVAFIKALRDTADAIEFRRSSIR